MHVIARRAIIYSVTFKSSSASVAKRGVFRDSGSLAIIRVRCRRMHSDRKSKRNGDGAKRTTCAV